MVSTRIPKVNQLIREELSKIIFREIDFEEGVLVTLTRVDAAPNLQQAKIYISTMPAKNAKEALNILGKNIYSIQQMLNKKLRMRPVPRIYFVEEKETVKAGKIEELLEKIKNNG